ncbi:hypothetical protein C2S51_015940 [Perilla frutescens var. frutescens]|nr:hypothetical protein C2S51_015940 [Perilla frutescens var. frutescens]
MNIDLNVSIENEASSEGSTHDRKDGEGAEQAYLLYCEYGRCRRFSVRNELRWKEFECSCEGRPDDKRSKGRVASYRKQITRSNCKAKLQIGREKNLQWTVHKFVKEHNHEMLGTYQAYLLRSARQLSHAKQSLDEALKSASIGVSRTCQFMENEAEGPQNVGFTRRDAYNHLNRVRQATRVGNVNANALVNLFAKKSNIEPFFYWNVQLDDEGRLMNFFSETLVLLLITRALETCYRLTPRTRQIGMAWYVHHLSASTIIGEM